MNPYGSDLTNYDFNPTVFYVVKWNAEREGKAHSHDYIEFTYIFSGNGMYVIDDVEYKVSAGDFIIFNPGTVHYNKIIDPNNTTTEFIAGFSDFQFKNMPKNSISLPNNNYIIKTTGKLKNDITSICNNMIEEHKNTDFGKYFMLKALLMQLVFLIMRSAYKKAYNEKTNTIENYSIEGCNIESYSKNHLVTSIIDFFYNNYSEKSPWNKLLKICI